MNGERIVGQERRVEPLRITIQWDGDGNAALAQYILEAEPELALIQTREQKIMLLTAVLWGPPVVLLTGYWVDRLSMGMAPFGWFLGALFVVLGLMAVNSKVGVWPAFRARLQARAVLGPRKASVPLTITADEHGISIADDRRTITDRWKTFEQVVRIPDFIAVIASNMGSGVTIPTSAFESPAAADAFEAGLRQLLVASGHERADRVRAALAQTSVFCACGHDLRGLMEPKCPECGREFTMLSLSIFGALRLPWWRVLTMKRPKQQARDR